MHNIKTHFLFYKKYSKKCSWGQVYHILYSKIQQSNDYSFHCTTLPQDQGWSVRSPQMKPHSEGYLQGPFLWKANYNMTKNGWMMLENVRKLAI